MKTWLYMKNNMGLWEVGYYEQRSDTWLSDEKDTYKLESDARERTKQLNNIEAISNKLGFLKYG